MKISRIGKAAAAVIAARYLFDGLFGKRDEVEEDDGESSRVDAELLAAVRADNERMLADCKRMEHEQAALHELIDRVDR